MSNKARNGEPGSQGGESEEHESWLREAAYAPQAARLPRPGDLVGGKYRIEDLIGRGGMGVVFRARHVVSERQVALKWMLRPASDEQARRRFEREARAAGRIDHPNVVSLFDIGEDGECSYLVMEFLSGESLRVRLGYGPLQPPHAVDLLLPAMRGVAAAHRAGVIHRDLKPDNIFLCRGHEGASGAVKVLDFGVSSITSLEAADSTLTQEGTLLGSLPYMSTEQFNSPHEVDVRADVYSFGVILYELLSGELPFRAPSHSALIVAIATTSPKPLAQAAPNVPPELEHVILRAMARERDRRYADMPSLIEALLPFASAIRASGEPPSRGSGAVQRTPTEVRGYAATEPVAGTAGRSRDEHDGSEPPRGPRAGRAMAWGLAVALLALAAFWALASDRNANPPAANRSNHPTPAALPPSQVVRVPEATAVPPAASEPRRAPPPPEVTGQQVAPVPATAPAAPARKARKPPPVARVTPASQAGKARSSAIEAQEKSLFSGRK